MPIYFTGCNAGAVSPVYGGMFAELQPGKSLEYTLEGAALAALQSGQYRIVVTYVAEYAYTEYLDAWLMNAAAGNTAGGIAGALGTLPCNQVYYKEFSVVSKSDVQGAAAARAIAQAEAEAF